MILRDNIELTHTLGLSCFVSFLISEARIGRVREIEGNLHAYIKNTTIIIRVSVQGVESLWGDCRFIPADWGS